MDRRRAHTETSKNQLGGPDTSRRGRRVAVRNFQPVRPLVVARSGSPPGPEASISEVPESAPEGPWAHRWAVHLEVSGHLGTACGWVPPTWPPPDRCHFPLRGLRGSAGRMRRRTVQASPTRREPEHGPESELDGILDTGRHEVASPPASVTATTSSCPPSRRSARHPAVPSEMIPTRLPVVRMKPSVPDPTPARRGLLEERGHPLPAAGQSCRRWKGAPAAPGLSL